jgi:hypothetical protein
MLNWVEDHQTLVWILTGTSIAVFIASVAMIPWIVSRIHPDYFTHDRRPPPRWISLPPPLRLTIIIAKNVLGVVLMIAGLAMLVLPGQGLITLFVGFFLIDFPGKYRFEKWLIRRKAVHRPINWFRRKSGREALELD